VYIRSLVVGGLLAAMTLVPASGALGFSSNSFQSPTGNIACRYDANNQVMACMTRNDGFTAAVSLYGRAYTTRGGTFVGGPIMSYGARWTASRRFRCFSESSGMTCRSVATGHGFFINRTSYKLF